MAYTKFGTVKAAVRESHREENSYIPVGVAFKDEQDRTIIKINALPRDPATWEGWLYIYPDTP